MTILDLDNVTTWDSIYNEFIRNDSYWSIIESALLNKSDNEFNSIIQGLENSIEYVKSWELISLRQRCTEYFKNIYTHVAAYHACRPLSIDSYLREGIIPSDTEKLIEEAKIYFNDGDAVSNVVTSMRTENFGPEYFDHGRDKIGFFISRTGSIEDSHYLKYGSELFQCIAKRLGEWAVQRMSSRGTPMLIQCSLPISWLNEFATYPMQHKYALAPLKQLIFRIRMPEKRFPISGAFMLKHSVSKEFILDIIDMTSLLTQNENI